MFDHAPVGPKCPILTDKGMSIQEAVGDCLPEFRAYKLGKKRWSYNQVELVVCEEGGNKQLTIKQAVHAGPASKGDDKGSGVSFEIILGNDEKLILDTFLVYDHPHAVSTPGGEGKLHEWTLVDRCACQRGCSGPVLRPIQRYGKLGKRSWGGSPSPDLTDRTNHNMKDTRYMYLSFDEAGTHVSFKSFRLITAVYDSKGRHLTSTASPPVRVLANNDVPTGAAHLQIVAKLPQDWEGWATALAPMDSLDARFAAAGIHSGSLRRGNSSNPTSQDSPSSSDGEAVNTSLRVPNYATLLSPYRTRRASAAREPQQPESPLQCLSTGNEPSSLLLDGTTARMTPGVEVASPPLQRCGGSLSMWLDNDGEQKNTHSPAPAMKNVSVTAHVTVPNNAPKRPRFIGAMTSSEPLPHSVDFEAHFPALLGPALGFNFQNHRSVAAAVAASTATGHHRAASDDPIAAFVELMMQNQVEVSPEEPIVELPGRMGGGAQAQPGSQQTQRSPQDLKGAMQCQSVNPMHRSILHNIPGTPLYIETPTPSALDELFEGIHSSKCFSKYVCSMAVIHAQLLLCARMRSLFVLSYYSAPQLYGLTNDFSFLLVCAAFDSILQDDASFPPVKLPTSPFASTAALCTHAV